MSPALGLGLISSVAQAREQTRVTTQNVAGLAEAAGHDFEAIAANSRQQMRQVSDQAGARSEDANREIGRINAIVADSNLSGNTAEMLRQEVLFSKDRDVATIQRNAADSLAQSQRQLAATRTKYSNAIRGQGTTSAVGTILGLGSTALSAPRNTTIGSLFGTDGTTYNTDDYS